MLVVIDRAQGVFNNLIEMLMGFNDFNYNVSLKAALHSNFILTESIRQQANSFFYVKQNADCGDWDFPQ